MFGWLTKRFKQTAIQPRGPRLQRQSYDAAALTPEALRDWANVDDLAADAAASPSIRTIIRKRGRHELLNNPYMDGIIQTLAGDVVGKTPRLRMRTAARSANSLIEREFAVWMKAIRLPSKLRLAVETVAAQGEIFGLLFSNPRLPTLIKLDVRFYEPDQIATPDIWLAADRDRVDGIEFDRAGNPRFYHVLREHPGDTRWLPIGMKLYDRVPAEWMVHLFKIRRPGQHRGIPRIMSSLPIFAQRRSFRQSVLTAARVAAQLGAVLLESEQDPNAADPLEAGVAIDAGTSLEMEHGMMTALPINYKARQMEATQPSTTYAEFDTRLVAESARPLNMPRNIAACDSSDYNYASGRLDHQTYDRSIDIDRGDLEDIILDPLLLRWLDEALTIPGYLPARTRSLLRNEVAHNWLWRRRPHVDPAKEATAQFTRLTSGATTLSRELAEEGEDFEDHAEELAAEVAWFAENGLVHPFKSQTTPQPMPDEDDDEEEGTNGSSNNGRRARSSRMEVYET